MYDKNIEVTGNLVNDIENYLHEILIIVNDKLRCNRVSNKLELQKHIESKYYNQLCIKYMENSDIPSIKIDNVLYFIYQYSNAEADWVVWNDMVNIEIMLHSDWAYRDLVGAMALLGQGVKTRFWNTATISDRSASELGYDRLAFKIKGVRLRDPKALVL